MSSSSSFGIQVAVRVRPEDDSPSGVAAERDLALAASDFAQPVLASSSTQAAVFASCGASLVAALFAGYAGSLFAYGVTGSGKTHTMLGADGGRSRMDGVVPQVASELFRQVNRQESDASRLGSTSQYEVRASYIGACRAFMCGALCAALRAR